MDTREEPQRAATPPAQSGRFPAPTRLGRYQVLEQLGAGGMGVVWAAWDDRLERRVALKLLHPQHDRDEALLLQEARTAARLEHPNVVRVHDAGVIASEVYVAFELIKGTHAGEWLRQARTPEQVLRLFLEAGRGLAAAHDAGLVHRDFKPENVMVGDDGRVVVTDFGLARVLDAPAEPSRESASPSLRTPSATQGTPAYMAPEQLEGGTLDARTDQFAFCVACWEALFGEHPFGEERATGERRAPRRPERAPAGVLAILSRGLELQPEARWPSMHELLRALGAALERPRRRRLAAIGAAATVVLVGAVAWGAHTVSVAAQQCSGAPARLASVWNDERRRAVGDALRAAHTPWSEATAALTVKALDERGAQWVEASRDACEATRSRGEASEAVLDARTACLQRRLGELDALVALLSTADSEMARHATAAVDQLPTVRGCAELDALLDRVPLPSVAGARERADALEARLAKTLAQHVAGRSRDAQPLLGPLVADAQALGWAPLEAEALWQAANVAFALEDRKAFEQLAEQSLLAAERGRDWDRAIDVRLELSFGARAAGRADEALEHARHAEALLQTRPDPVRQARLAADMARALLSTGALTEALAQAQRAVATTQGLGADRARRLSAALNTRAMVYSRLGRGAEALDDFQRSAALRAEVAGPDHPDALVAAANASAALIELGRFDESERELAALLPRTEAVAGPRSSLHVMLRANHAMALQSLGRNAEARAEYEALLPLVRELDPKHPRVGRTLLGLGRCDLGLAEPSPALEHFREAEGALGPNSADRCLAVAGQAKATLRLGKAREARALAERALELAKEEQADEGNVATIEVVLAQARAELGERAEALSQVSAARKALAANPQFSPVLAEVDGWLERNAPARP